MSLLQMMEEKVEFEQPLTERTISYSMQAASILRDKHEYVTMELDKIDVLRFSSDLEGLLKYYGVPTVLIPVTLCLTGITRLSRYGTETKIKVISESQVDSFINVIDEF